MLLKLKERAACAESRLSEESMKCTYEPAAGNGSASVRVKGIRERCRLITLNLGGITALSSLGMAALLQITEKRKQITALG